VIAAVQRFRRHVRTPSELRLLLSVTAFMAAIPWLMRRSLPSALRRLEWISRRLAPRRADPEKVIRYVGALGSWKRWSFQDNCVVRSLCYYAFLNRGDDEVALMMGVERRTGAEGGVTPGRRHFWVTRNGEPLNETVDVNNYHVMLRYPSESA